MALVDRLAALCAQFPDLRAQPGLLVSLALSQGSDQQVRDVASFAQATSWRRVLESVPADHAQAMWDRLDPTDRQRVLGSGYSPVIERNEGRGFWANNAPQAPAPEAFAPASPVVPAPVGDVASAEAPGSLPDAAPAPPEQAPDETGGGGGGVL